MGKQIFNIKGMMRDLDPEKSSNQYAFEIRNLRLTAQEDTTLLALTTEKGNLQYTLSSSIVGTIVGYCVLNKYITIFTHDTSADHIYRLEEDTTVNYLKMTVKSLYSGSLGFDYNTKIEAIGVYENEKVQKVYWIDGINQTRFININGNPSDWVNRRTPFDFLPKMNLNESVTVSRSSQYGIFESGTIQYVLSYYNKYGQGTNSFYVSPIYYISPSYRGASPEESVSCSFKIQVSNVDDNFDFIRIYSIHRTSENGIPICKIVTDIPYSSTVVYIDNGMEGTIIDYSEILYLGGANIVPYTFEAKNNTLFFGNYKENSFFIKEADMITIKNAASVTFSRGTSVMKGDVGSFYMYNNQLLLSAENITTFKGGESYYFGIIVQNDRGQWSNVVPIGRFTNSYYPDDNTNMFMPVKATVILQQDAIDKLSEYKKIKVVILDEPPSIICQGVLCPTVYNKSRKDSGGIFSQSSWFFRPIGESSSINHLAQNKHNSNIRTDYSLDSISEIYGASSDEVSAYQTSDYDFNIFDFFVDWNILTLHSPDIEFGNIISNADKIKIVGITPVTAGITSMVVTTQSPTKRGVNGLHYNPLINNHLSTDGFQLDLSTFCYEDNKVVNNTWTTTQVWKYPILPWHRNASLSAQTTPASTEQWYGLLDSKCMASLRSSAYNIFTYYGNTYLYDITPCQIYQDDQSLLSIPADSGNLDFPSSKLYAGSMNTVLSGGPYGVYGKYNDSVSQLGSDSSPISMKYKSGKHGVFALKYDNNKQTILPAVPGDSSYTTLPFWSIREIPYPFTTNYDYQVKHIVIQDTGGDYIYASDSGVQVLFIKRSYLSQNLGLGDFITFSIVNTTLSQSQINTITGSIYWVVAGTSTTYPDSEWYTICTLNGTIRWSNFFEQAAGFPYSPRPTSEDGETLTWYFFEETTTRYRLLSVTATGSYVSASGGDYVSWQCTDNCTVVATQQKTTYQISRKTLGTVTSYKYLYLVDLIGDTPTNPQSFKYTKWKVAGLAKSIPASPGGVDARIGDTYYQRYDCLKTYPYSLEDQNQIVEIFSFMCETRVNIDGRYDTRRGQVDNTTVTNTNFNLLNKAYTQEDNFFTYHYLDPDDYDIDEFPNQIIWTKTKVYGSDVDAWTQIVPTSTLDMDGTLGEITALKLWNDNLICFQDMGIAKIMYNERTTISTQQGVPVEIANSGKVDGSQYISNQIGCSNKDSIQVTQDGIYFIDSNTREIYKWSKGLESLSKGKGFNTYLYNSTHIDDEKTFYDPKLKDVYFRFGNECLVYNEQLGEFTSFLDYDMEFMFPYKDSLIAIKDNNLWKQFANSNYLSFFGVNKGYNIDIVSAEQPTEDKIFSTVEFRASVLSKNIQESGSQSTDNDENIIPFNKIRVWNEYQDTGEVNFERQIKRGTGANLAQKFRIWRGDIPREAGSPLKRIRNPWARIKLYDDKKDNKRTVVHDIAVTYF